MGRSKNASVNRRDFLRGSAAGVAVLAAAVTPVSAQDSGKRAPGTPPPMSKQAETGEPVAEVLTTDRPGADFMVDVIKSLGIEYVARESRIQLSRFA